MTQLSFALYFFTGVLAMVAPLQGREQTPAWPPDAPAPAVAVPMPETLTIRIIAGENGFNYLKRRFVVSPVVEVRDRNNQPVAGATVTFTSPEVGPGIRFVPGREASSAVTELDGRATASKAVPVRLGKFQMMVTARYADYQMATAVVHQTNFKNTATAKKNGVSVRMRSPGSHGSKP